MGFVLHRTRFDLLRCHIREYRYGGAHPKAVEALTDVGPLEEAPRVDDSQTAHLPHGILGRLVWRHHQPCMCVRVAVNAVAVAI